MPSHFCLQWSSLVCSAFTSPQPLAPPIVLIILISPTLPVVIALFPYDSSELNQTQTRCSFSPLHLSLSLSFLSLSPPCSHSHKVFFTCCWYNGFCHSPFFDSPLKAVENWFHFSFHAPRRMSLRCPQYHHTQMNLNKCFSCDWV